MLDVFDTPNIRTNSVTTTGDTFESPVFREHNRKRMTRRRRRGREQDEEEDGKGEKQEGEKKQEKGRAVGWITGRGRPTSGEQERRGGERRRGSAYFVKCRYYCDFSQM